MEFTKYLNKTLMSALEFRFSLYLQHIILTAFRTCNLDKQDLKLNNRIIALHLYRPRAVNIEIILSIRVYIRGDNQAKLVFQQNSARLIERCK